MPFEPTADWLKKVAGRMVELPLAKKRRLMADYQLPACDAQTLVWDAPLGAYFEALARQSKNPKAIANWVINNLRARLSQTQTTLDRLNFKPDFILQLVSLVDERAISSSIAQQVFAEMFDTGRRPQAIVSKNGWAQVSDTAAIEALCDQAIAAHPGPAADYKAGKTAALNFLKGQVMKLSKGKANPNVVGEILEAKLKP
jgi:aspartyl-tRNA(Asn)/glutamyl-tRNA(Gln) amidotransferase subunit B